MVITSILVRVVYNTSYQSGLLIYSEQVDWYEISNVSESFIEQYSDKTIRIVL